MHYSIEPTEKRYVKGYGFLSFARNLNNKYGQKLVDSAKKFETHELPNDLRLRKLGNFRKVSKLRKMIV